MQLVADELEQMESRHNAQMLSARAVPADPYTAWLQERESGRRSGILATPVRPAGRFSRKQPARAPWDAMPVTLSAEIR